MNRLLAFILLFLLLSCHLRQDRKKLSGIMKLPTFRIMSMDSCKCISTENFPSGKPYIFIYFDPDCEHCQHETKSILSHIDQLRNANLYWVTNGDPVDLKKFCQYFRIDTLENAMIGNDYEYGFYRAFLPPSTPYIAIYNGRKGLVKLYKGEPDVNAIIASTRD